MLFANDEGKKIEGREIDINQSQQIKDNNTTIKAPQRQFSVPTIQVREIKVRHIEVPDRRYTPPSFNTPTIKPVEFKSIRD